MNDDSFDPLISFLQQVPAVKKYFGKGFYDDGNWWIKFGINVENTLAWRVVQEIGFVTNYLSLDEKLPTLFYPVSPPPYLNGGIDFLSWIIESKTPDFTPNDLREWLEGRLPNPVSDIKEWNLDDED